MKTRFFYFLLVAGISLAGCSTNKEGQSGMDSIDSVGMSGTMADSVTLPADTMRMDSTMQDTTARPPL